MKRTAILRKPDTTARLTVPVYRPKRCKACKETFTPTRAIQPVCEVMTCKLGYATALWGKRYAERVKEERKADRARAEKLKTRSDFIQEAKAAFHKFVRLRDYGKTCISCPAVLGDPVVGGAYDAGHWRSVGSAAHLRFDERNVHGQCKRCNRWGSGMAVDYRAGLLARFGLDLVEALEADQTPRHYDIEDLKALKTYYRAKARELEKRNG